MADTLKILAQAELAATTLTDVYTVPASRSTTVSTITVCNRTGANLTFRLSVAAAGAADTNSQYLYYDMPLPAKDTFAITLGITLSTTDKIRAYASAAGVSVNVFGVEVS